jgi:deoxyribodipyrimidine photo-lyase
MISKHKEHAVALVWLRRDLRLADNPALTHALEHAHQVVLLYLHALEEEAPWSPGAASLWWLHHSLQSLQDQIAQRHGRLILRQGDSLACLKQLITETAATLVCWNRVYEPVPMARDTCIKTTLKSQGIEVRSFNAALLFEPWVIQNQQGNPFKVFTPFWRHCNSQLSQQATPRPAPEVLPVVNNPVSSLRLDELAMLPRIPWDTGLRACWRPGEAGAHARLQHFMDETATHYALERDRPDKPSTSKLSPHLHFGEIGPRQIIAALTAQGIAAEAFVRELGWREFSYHLLYHFPNTPDQSLDARFEFFSWQHNALTSMAWRRGRTGIPIVDAGMRELWHTGYMHNRVRMIAASFLTKNLRIHWREGARWFWDTLVDADLANNTQGWQWTAGCGADAAPYFRVFNPVLQTEKFDPQCIYLRRWLPELVALPNKWLPAPWTAPESELKRAGITLGVTYPRPIVDLSVSRAAALTAYRQVRTQPL